MQIRNKHPKKQDNMKSIKEIKAEIKQVNDLIQNAHSSKELTMLMNRLSHLHFDLNCAMNPIRI
jgi:uncharacterized protein YjgD (DUF1641 family)